MKTQTKTNHKIIIKFLIIVLFISGIMSCSNRINVKNDNIEPEIQLTLRNNSNTSSVLDSDNPDQSINNKALTGNNSLQQTGDNISLQSDYVLGAEDLLEIDVYQVSELNRTVRISSSGYIKLPLSGEVKAAGLTVPELEAELSKRLDRYLQEPMVTVFVKEYRSQRITVLGAVQRPGVHVVTGQKFLLDVLSLSEGLTENAGNVCYVQRGNKTIVIDLNELLIKGNAKLNIPVVAGDVVHVPNGGVIFVSGAVNEPGSFIMQGSVTLTQAIAMAKGLKYEASKGQIRIYRDSGGKIRDTIDIDYDNILDKKSADVILKDKDIVIVPTNGARSFFKGFIETLGGFITFGKAL